MKNSLAVEVAYATSAVVGIAVAPELEVYERAVTRQSSRGQVCPSTGSTGFGTSPWTGSDLSARFDVPRTGITATDSALISASSVMNNVQLSNKPRVGYCAMSGTG